jgi:hypothetical protein
LQAKWTTTFMKACMAVTLLNFSKKLKGKL